MFCKIELFPKKEINNDDEVVELLWTFLNSLKHNGQILKEYNVVEGENYTLYVTLPKEDSFEEKYDNIYVKRDRAKIKELFDKNNSFNNYIQFMERKEPIIENKHSHIK